MNKEHTRTHRFLRRKRIPALFLAILLFITSAVPAAADEVTADGQAPAVEAYTDESLTAESALTEGADSDFEVPSVEPDTSSSSEEASAEEVKDASQETSLPEETSDASGEESLPEEASDDSAETQQEETLSEDVADLPAEESQEESLPEGTSATESAGSEDPEAIDGEIQFADNDEELITGSDDAAPVSAGKVIVGTNGMPVLNIILSNTTLEQIKNGLKDTKYKGNTVDLTIDGNVSQHTDVEIKGRGNSTWPRPKKPFQIKFDKKQDLFGQGKAKKWILLANDLDYSHLRNDVGLTLAANVGIPGALPRGQHVEVYFNGVYEGLYYLTRKVEVGTVPLKDDKGIIVELEHLWTPDSPFGTSAGGTRFGTKETVIDSDIMDEQKAVFDSFMASYNEFENAIIRKDWETACSYADMVSFAKVFILSDFTGGQDMFASSSFMHKDGDSDVIHAGPMWDFDLAYAGRGILLSNESTNPYRTWAYMDVRECPDSREPVKKWAPLYEYLMNVPEFRELVRNVYWNSVRKALTDISGSLEGRSSAISAARAKELAKWHPGVSGDAETASLRKYLSERINYFDFLYGETAPVSGICSMKGAYTKETVKVSRTSDGYYVLSNRNGSVLDVAGAKKAEGARVQWYSYNGTDAQKWLPLKSGALVSKETGFILTQKQDGGLYISRASLSGGKPSAAQTFTFQNISEDIASASKNAITAVEKAEDAAVPVLKAYGMVLKEGADYTVSKTVSERVVRYTFVGIGSFTGKMNIDIRIVHDGGFESGVFYRISSKLDRRKVLTVKSGSLANHGNVQIESFSGMLEDYWLLEKQSDGTYFIRNARSGLLLDVNGGMTRNCTNIQQYTQNGSNAQRFIIDKRSDEAYEIISVNSRKAVDVASAKTADGTNVQIYDPNNSRAQRWYIEAAGRRPDVSGSYKIVSCLGKADKAVSVAGTSRKDKANIFLWTVADSMSANWILTENGDANKTWSIRSGYSGKTLDVAGTGTRAGTNVWQYTYSKDNNAQKWVLMEDLKSGSCTIFSICSGMALDVSGASNKNRANIQIYTPNGTAAQKWSLRKVG